MLEDISVRLPTGDQQLGQDEEYCLLTENGRERSIRFHDYDKLYEIPGLYETIFYDMLQCSSPEVISTLLADEVKKAGNELSDLSMLDLGAGNGMVGEELRGLGVQAMVAVDIIEEAAKATERDRPDLYDKYYVGDVRELAESAGEELAARKINGMTCVAALGFGDIPPSAFEAGYNIVAPGGWLAFNIKDAFLTDREQGGFAGLIRTMMDDGRLIGAVQHHYTHRLSVSGDPLEYVAIVARKPEN